MSTIAGKPFAAPLPLYVITPQLQRANYIRSTIFINLPLFAPFSVTRASYRTIDEFPNLMWHVHAGGGV